MSDETTKALAAKVEKEPATVVLRVEGPVGVSSFTSGDVVVDRTGTEVAADSAEDLINSGARSGVLITEVTE